MRNFYSFGREALRKSHYHLMYKSDISIHTLQPRDCLTISQAFAAQGWNKPVSQYERYLEHQNAQTRKVLVAETKGEFAGYLVIQWNSDYLPFKAKGIPEIIDLNVLQKFQRNKVATVLMDEAERQIKQVSPVAGIGFGLTKDYGPAQIMYIKRGYLPNGRGIVKASKSLEYGQRVTIDDDLVMYLTKLL